MVNISASSRQRLGCVVVALREELDISDATRMAGALSAAAASGSRIMVDLAGLTFIDCSSLHALVSARKQARQAGGDLVLASPRQPVARLVSLTDLIELPPAFASVKQAANGSRAAPAAVCLTPEQANGEVLPGNDEVSSVAGEASLARLG